MLKPAIEYKDELRKKRIDNWHKKKYKYVSYGPSSFLAVVSGSDITENTWNRHQFASIHNNEVIGYISYKISQQDHRVYGLEVINFTDDVMPFSLDLKRIFKNIFELYKFNKISFAVIIGNPIEKTYDRIVSKYNGRIVGTRLKHIKLSDKQYYDVKEYEVFREGYLNGNNRRTQE